ncbi:MAG: sugar ABC transporter permease, partial [Bacilli bacterium]|nr:sugar ABC transporter permease [Bacilli bacterium]
MRFKKEKLPLNSKALSNGKTKERLKIKRDLFIKKNILARKEYEDQALVSLKDENYFKKLHNLDVKVKKLSKRLEILDRKIENSDQAKKNLFSNLKTWLLDYKYINQHIPRYATSYEKDAIKEELELKKLRLKRNLQNVNREYIKEGRLASSKPWRRRRVFTFSKMMKDLKKQINGIGIDLQRLETGNYEVLSFFGKIKKFFASLSYQQQKAIFGILFVLPWLVGFIIFFAYPMFTTFWWSLNNMEAQLGGGYLMKFVGFGNFKALFTSKTLSGVTMAELLTSSLLSIVLDIPTIIIFSLFVAILLNTKFKGYQIARLIFFIPVVYNLAVINNTLTGHFGQMFGSELSNRVVLSDQFSNFIRQIGIGGGLIDFLVDAVNRIFSIVNR